MPCPSRTGTRISRDRDGALELTGRCWQDDGSLSTRYWSDAAKERKEPSGVFLTVMDGSDHRRRAELISERLGRWKALTNA
jgi:hypothetical protein